MESFLELLAGSKKIPLILCLVGATLIFGGMFISSTPKTKTFPQESIIKSNLSLKVDISGAVLNPGVYDMSESGRIDDLIQMAGGFRDDANQEYISKHLNLAQKVVDGSKVYIPFIGEEVVLGTEQSSSKVNINSASSESLEGLSGVGAVTASKIIAGRPYSAIEDLLSKKVIGRALFEKIKDQLIVY